MVEENEYYKKEMEKLERRSQSLTDQYNSLDNHYEEQDFNRILNANLDYAPKSHQTWMSYYESARIFAGMNAKKNIKTHINGPKGAWYTHRNPMGCFACEDTNLINVLLAVIGIMSHKMPLESF